MAMVVVGPPIKTSYMAREEMMKFMVETIVTLSMAAVAVMNYMAEMMMILYMPIVTMAHLKIVAKM